MSIKSDNDRREVFDYLEKCNSSFVKFINRLEDEDIEVLAQFVEFLQKGHEASNPVNINLTKMLFSLRRLSNSDVQRIEAFLESTGYGWQDNKYKLSNLCLTHPTDHCKHMSATSDPNEAQSQLKCLVNIFFYSEYGQIMLLIFCYCLAALFSKRMNRERLLLPFYLQIACDRHSVLFQLIEEIVEICDVNSGLIDFCSATSNRRCEYRSQVYYPTQSTKSDLEALIRENNDVTVIVDGSENLTYYNNLLRCVANIPNSRTPIEIRDSFNTIPLFVCPTIKSSFGNVFNLDLSDLDVNIQYLEFVRKNKSLLASHVLELVKDSNRYLFSDIDELYSSETHPFKHWIKGNLNVIRKHYPDLTLDNAKNICFLILFFRGFLNVFRKSFLFSEPIKLYNNTSPMTVDKHIDHCINRAEKNLANLHLRYLPAPYEEGLQNKEATQLAKQIMKHYASLHVAIRVIPISVQEKRFVYRVDTLQETKDADVISKSETVQHRLKKYECFRFDMTDGKQIKLIVAESQLQDNSLLNILHNDAFSDPVYKIPYAIGIDEIGQPYIEDIAKFPHLLLGGATNSGKSTAIWSLLLSIAYRHQTGDAYVIIMDLLSSTGESAFSMFNGHPIMACPVIQDPLEAAKVVFALHDIMKSRPQDPSDKQYPYIVCVIDEFPTLYNDLSKEYVEQIKLAMTDLLAKGRHANIHLVLAAQDPTKDSVGKVSNAKARMAFQCSHYRYSNNIIGCGDAAKLHGKGQMILNSEFVHGKRLLGSYIDATERKKLLNDTKASFVQKNPNRVILSASEASDNRFDAMSAAPNASTSAPAKESRFKTFEELLPAAIMWTLPQEKVANSRLLKYLHVRDALGREIIEWMHAHDLLIQLNGNHGWKVKAEKYNDLDNEVIRILLDAGYTESNIHDKLNKRKQPYSKHQNC